MGTTRPTSAPPERLPPSLTSFVGRRTELEALRRLFDEGRRLVSLLGPPGAGKTRLSIELGRIACEALDLRGGVAFVDCSDARDVEGLHRALANVFGVSLAVETTPAAIEERLCQAMDARGRGLVVLDNFEQLVHVAAGSVTRWLELTASTSFLVTSRERIGIAGEHTYDLPPLPLPSAADDVRTADSVVLFVDRARAVRASYEPTTAELSSIAEICRELDGLPLALELAAARMRVMSPEQIRMRLGARLDFLVDRMQGATGRHATLASAIQWSWELLTPAERDALAQCALFRGGFDLDGLEGILRIPGSSENAIDVVESLRDKSLLALLDSRSEVLRFGLLASIQQFAHARLDESGSRAALEERFVDYFARFADEWASRRETADGGEAGERLGAEIENLLSAFAHVRPSHDSTASMTLAVAIGWIALDRGPIATGLRCLDDALAQRRERDTGARKTITALLLRGRLRLLQGTAAEAADDFREAADRARTVGDRRLECTAVERVGTIARIRGDDQAAEAALSSALAIATELGDALLQSRVLCALALARSRSHSEAAYAEENLFPMLRKAVALARVAGSRRLEQVALANLGHLEASVGRDDEAREHVRAALAIRDAGHLIRTILNTGALFHLEDRLLEAADAYREALEAARRFGDRPAEVMTLAWYGLVSSEMEREAASQAAFDEALLLADRSGDRARRAGVLALRSCCEATRGRGAAASSDLAEARDIALAIDATVRWEIDAMIDLALGIFEAAEAERAVARGAEDAAAELRASARRRLVAHLREPSPPTERLGWPLLIRWCSLDLRLQARALCRLLEAGPGMARPLIEMVVARDATWFVAPGTKAETSLARRGALRRVFASLIEARNERSGEPLSVDDILSLAWPGEKMQRDAGVARVYASIPRLRKMGLQSVVLSRDDGYIVDPRVLVRFDPE